MRILLSIGVVSLTLLASCASCDDSKNGNKPGNVNGNRQSNSNSGSGIPELATPRPSLAPSSPLDSSFRSCNPYYPLIPGSQATYSLVYGQTGLQATPNIVVDQITENGVTVYQQTTQIEDTAGGMSKSERAIQKCVCDNGRVKVIAENSDNNVEGHKSLMEMHYADPAYLMLEPAALRPGATWSYSFTQTFHLPDGTTSNSDRSNTFACTVQGEEEVTVPAGKFKAVKINKKINKVEVDEYYARGMGLIKRRNSDGTTWELTSYSGLKPAGE